MRSVLELFRDPANGFVRPEFFFAPDNGMQIVEDLERAALSARQFASHMPVREAYSPHSLGHDAPSAQLFEIPAAQAACLCRRPAQLKAREDVSPGLLEAQSGEMDIFVRSVQEEALHFFLDFAHDFQFQTQGLCLGWFIFRRCCASTRSDILIQHDILHVDCWNRRDPSARR